MNRKWYVIRYRSLETALACLLTFLCVFNFKINITSSTEVPLRDIAVVFMLFVEALHKNSFCRDIIRQKTIILWLIFLLGGLATFIWTQDLETARSTWLDFLFLFLIVLALLDYIRNDGDMKAVLTVYVLCAMILAVMGMYENITGYHFHVTYESYLVRKNAFGFYPANTIFYNTNDMASFITLSVPVGFICAEHSKKPMLIKIPVLLILGTSAVMSASRSAVLGILIFVILILAIRKNDSLNFFILIFGGVIFFLAIDFWASTYLGQFLSSDGDSGRSLVWINTLYNARKVLFMGIGPGCANIVNAYSQYEYTQLLAVHNYFLQIFAEFGTISFVAFLDWFINLFRRVFWNRKTRYKNIRRIANYQLAGLIVFIIVSISSSDMTTKSWVYAWLAIQFAVIRILRQMEEQQPEYESTYGTIEDDL